MQFRKFLRHLLFPAVVFLFMQDGFSQELRENEKGEKIIVYPDGTWQYFGNLNHGDNSPFKFPSDSSENTKKYPVYSGDVSPLREVMTPTEGDLRKIAKRKVQIAQNAVTLAEAEAKLVNEERLRLERQLSESLQAKGNANAPELVELEDKLNEAKRKEEQANLAIEQAKRQAARALLQSKNKSYLNSLVASDPNNLRNRNNRRNRNTRQALDFERDRPLNAPTAYNTPPPVCRIAFEGKDSYSGQFRKDVQKQLLFTYTDEALKPILQQKEYLRCSGFISSLNDKDYFLSLEFSFAFPNALEAYGIIEKESILSIRLIDGDYVHLSAGELSQGSYNTETELLNYHVHYYINDSQLDFLRIKEVDNIRVFWSSGFEVYDIFDVDFFMNQIACLER